MNVSVEIAKFIESVFSWVGNLVWDLPWRHSVDVALMSFIVYQVYIRIRGTRAMRILAGIVALGLGYLTTQAAGLFLTSWVLGGISARAKRGKGRPETLFAPPAPLHDGALYVRGGRAYRAGCVLPLSDDPQLSYFYGTRHRAAVGITEQSDAGA